MLMLSDLETQRFVFETPVTRIIASTVVGS